MTPMELLPHFAQHAVWCSGITHNLWERDSVGRHVRKIADVTDQCHELDRAGLVHWTGLVWQLTPAGIAALNADAPLPE